MNAFGNPIGSPNGVQREQTMEEILASIRKIIESNEAIVSQSAEELGDYDTQDDKYQPAQPVAHQTITPPIGQPVAQPVQLEVPAYIPPVAQPVETPVASLQSEMARLVSQSPERRVAAAFDDLNSAFLKSKQMPLEGVAEGMLRPMMQEWLDNNLPNLVERLVREEITRIARGDI